MDYFVYIFTITLKISSVTFFHLNFTMKIQQNYIFLHINQTTKFSSAWILSIISADVISETRTYTKSISFSIFHINSCVSLSRCFSWDAVASANPCYVLPWILCTDVMWGILFSYASLLSGDDLVRGKAEREPHQLSLPGCGVPRK